MREREGVTNGLCIVLRPQIAFHMVMRCSLQKLQSPLVFWFAGGRGGRLPVPLHLRHGADVLRGPSLLGTSKKMRSCLPRKQS